MAKQNIKPKSTRGWAIVSKRGKIQIDTVCKDRESVNNFVSLHDTQEGCKVRRVIVQLAR